MKRLRNLRVREVSLVKSPANKKKFIVYKSEHKGGAMPKAPDVSRAIRNLDEAKMAPIYKAVAARRAVGKAAPPMRHDDAAAQAAQDAGLSDQAQTQLNAIGRILATSADEITAQDVMAVCEAAGLDCSGMDMGDDGDTDEEPEIELSEDDSPQKAEEDDDDGQAEKAEDDQGEMPGEDVGGDLEVDLDADKPDDVTESDHADAMDAAKMAYQAHVRSKKKPATMQAVGAKGPMGHGAKGGKPTMKSATKPDSEQLRDIQKAQKVLEDANRSLLKQNAELKEEVRQERDHRVLKSMQDQVAADFPALGVETEKVARVLKAFKDAGQTEAHDEYVAVLKAANAQVELSRTSGGNMFGTMGATLHGTEAKGAEAQLQALVDSAVQKSTNGKTRQQIAVEVYQTPEGRRLANKALQERSA